MINKEVFPHPWSVHNYLLRIRGGEALYMESGLFDMLNIAPLNDDSYKPAQLYYDSVLTPYANTDTALMGEIKVSRNNVTYNPRGEGSSESSVGCEEDDLLKVITMTNYLGGGTEVASASTPTYCGDLFGIWNRKRAQVFFPSSAFSGKMKQFVQSLYGSRREDYSMDELLGSLGGLTIDGQVFDPYFNTAGSVLYTGEDYTYYVLLLSAASVRVAQLQLSDKGEDLRQWLLDNPQSATETRRYEGYLLSTATFSDWHTIGDVSSAYAKGSPMAYSWHSNWDGTEAQIVTVSLKDGTDNVWKTTHFKATISLTPRGSESLDWWQEEDSWSVVASEVEETQEVTFRVNEDLIWTPDYIDGGMQIFESQPDAGSNPTPIESDVPIYVVYNYDDDDFDVIRFSRTDLPTGDGAFGGGLSSASDPAPIIGCGTDVCDYYSNVHDGGAIEVGFFVEDYQEFTAKLRQGTTVEVQGNEARLTSSDGEERLSKVSASTTECGYEPLPNEDGKVAVYYDCFGAEASMTGDFALQSMLVCPFYDCDAIYLGYWYAFSGDISGGKTTDEAIVRAAWNYYDGASLSTPNVRDSVKWDTIFPSSEQYIKERAQINGHWDSGSESEVDWADINIHYYSNGEDTLAYESKSSSFIDPTWLHIPSCLVRPSEGFDISQNFEEGSPNPGGFEFDPVLFPDPENALPIVARRNITGNYRATANPGSSFIDDGDYTYDELSQHISYVGHD